MEASVQRWHKSPKPSLGLQGWHYALQGAKGATLTTSARRPGAAAQCTQTVLPSNP